MLHRRRVPAHLLALLLWMATAPATPQDTEDTRATLRTWQLAALGRLGFTDKDIEIKARRRPADWVTHCRAEWSRLSFLRAEKRPDGDTEKRCRDLLDRVPTDLQDPFDYETVRQRFEQIHSVAASQDRLSPIEPLLGTLDAGDIDAGVSKPGAYILAVNGGALRFSLDLSKILAWSLPTLQADSARGPFDADWPEVLKYLRATPEPGHRFRELLVAFVARKHPYFAARHYMDAKVEERALDFAKILTWAAQLFLVGHEYAHLTDGHLEGKLRRRPEEGFGEEPIRLRVRTLEANLEYSRELDADQLGLRLVHSALPSRVDGSASILGAVLCLRAIEILDNARTLGTAQVRSGSLGRLADCATQREGDRSHPPTSCRVWLLKQHARNEPEVLRRVELLERILEYHCTEAAVGVRTGRAM